MTNQEFNHKVTVTVDKNQPVSYSHPFPVRVGNSIQERWCKKPLPPKGYSQMLRSLGCYRNRDYFIRVNTKEHGLDYFFEQDTKAFLFKMAIGQNVAGGVTQSFLQCCPNCKHTFRPDETTTV